jgi:hypothetical protein
MVNRSRKQKINRKSRGGYIAPYGQFGKELNSIQLAQGQQFHEINKAYHGGAVYHGGPYPGGVTNSTLPPELQASAHLNPLNRAFAEINGLKDQAGGKRKKGKKSAKKTHKSKKSTRKSKKAKKSRKTQRKYHGGALGFMPMTSFDKMLLPAGLEGKAGLNPDWKLAEDPNAFAPY